MLLVISLFAAPVVLAWGIFYLFPGLMEGETVNHGTLVSPVRALPAFKTVTGEGKAIDETFLRGKWTFIYLAQGVCDEPCVQQLYNIRQARLTQGKNIDRLQRLMFWKTDGVDAAQQVQLQEHFPGQDLVRLTEVEAAALAAVFRLDEQDPFTARRVYLVDPLGNLMMYYDMDDDPRGIVKDLQRLLKYSGLG
jgi:cytochrome oxidase Cu insertion factor (SCO1/SenC/PrrC family)